MKKILVALLASLLLFTACDTNSQSDDFMIHMDMTENYDDQDPFIDERLFYVTENINALQLECIINFDGGNGVLEIMDNTTKKVIWEKSFDEIAKNMYIMAEVKTLDKDKEYVIRFKGYKIKKADIVITSDHKSVKERERPINK